MKKEQEVELDKLKTYLEYAKKDNLDKFILDVKTAETILSMLKEKDKEINSQNGTINALQCALKERTEERDRKDNIVTKQNKIIDLMAEYITYCFNEDEGICKKSASRINNQDYDCDNNCKGCIKQYFEKLAKEKGE